MTFNLRMIAGEDCDKCKKLGTVERPLVDMWTMGKHRDQRNFIQVHEDCLLKAIAKAKRENEQPEDLKAVAR